MRGKKQSEMLIARSARATYAEDSGGDKVGKNQATAPTGGSDDERSDIDNAEEGQDGVNTEYLPLPRTKDNPNARGGAINVQPQAPNHRLD